MRATVLCYNLKGTTKGRKIGLIFGFLGYRVRHVEKEEYLLPIGEVAEGRTTESINEEAGVKANERNRSCISRGDALNVSGK